MAGAVENPMPLDEFLAWERKQPERYEYADGVVTMMAGETEAHATIAANLISALRQTLRGSGCRPFGSDMKIMANKTIRYPDVSVIRRPIDHPGTVVRDPVLVIEVRSPATERIDRGRKKFDDVATPSIRQYAIVEQEERRIDLNTKRGNGWVNEVVTDGALDLSSVGVALALDTIYEDTELAAIRPPASPSPAGRRRGRAGARAPCPAPRQSAPGRSRR
jgi:Uma2 family endonuclease